MKENYYFGQGGVKMGILLNLFDVIKNKDEIVKSTGNIIKNISSTDEHLKESFLKNLKKDSWGVHLVIGKSGGGKTALCVRMAEFLNRPTYAINMLKTPEWIDPLVKIRIHEDENGNYLGATFIYPDGTELKADKHCTVIIDDAANILESNKMYEDVNSTIKKLAFISRHLDIAFFVNVQDSSSLNKQVVGQARVAWFKEPALFQFGTDRDFIAKLVEEEVKPFFDSLPKTLRKKYTYIYCADFKGVIVTGLSKGWSQAISENKG